MWSTVVALPVQRGPPIWQNPPALLSTTSLMLPVTFRLRSCSRRQSVQRPFLAPTGMRLEQGLPPTPRQRVSVAPLPSPALEPIRRAGGGSYRPVALQTQRRKPCCRRAWTHGRTASRDDTPPHGQGSPCSRSPLAYRRCSPRNRTPERPHTTAAPYAWSSLDLGPARPTTMDSVSARFNDLGTLALGTVPSLIAFTPHATPALQLEVIVIAHTHPSSYPLCSATSRPFVTA